MLFLQGDCDTSCFANFPARNLSKAKVNAKESGCMYVCKGENIRVTYYVASCLILKAGKYSCNIILCSIILCRDPHKVLHMAMYIGSLTVYESVITCVS